MSHFDRLYRRLLISKNFSKGWGNPENLKRLFEFREVLSNRETCQQLVGRDYPVTIDKEYEAGGVCTLEGHFLSPFVTYLPGIVPNEVETARFQMILPSTWTTKQHPVCVHLAGTGDHFYWRRRTLCAKPLLREYGIASVLLENPYYGLRKPKIQKRSCLMNVTDLFIMGGCLILESLVLFHWLERQGWGPLGITGVSMGGHMASLAATNWHKPISLIPCLSWSTASCVFTKLRVFMLIATVTQGVMSGSIPWDILQTQYIEDSVYESEIRRLFHPTHGAQPAAFDLGKTFARYYPRSFQEIQDIRGDDYTTSQLQSDATQSSRTGCTDQHRTVKNKENDFENLGIRNPRDRVLIKSSPSQESRRERLADEIRISAARSTLREDALDFMRGIMDEFTHLAYFSVPVDPRLVVIVVAKRDAYIPRDDVFALDSLWPGCEVRYIDLGHIGTFLFKQAAFRKAINDAFTRQIQLHSSRSADNL